METTMMITTKSDRFINQTTSARWILTILAGVSFFAFSMAVAYVILKQRMDFKPETVIAMFSSLLLIIQGVYKDYFHKINGDANNSNSSNDPQEVKTESQTPKPT